MKKDFDLLIIGAGSAGFVALKEAQKHGLRVAIVENASELGGLCILRGCMPSKTLLESANRLHEIDRAPEFAIRANGKAHLDVPALVARKRRLIVEFVADRRKEMLDACLLRGRASFTDSHTVELAASDGSRRELRAETFLLSTGSQVKIIPLPGLEEAGYLTSDDVLDCERAFASVVVLGAGPVGLELAHYYRCQGTQVTLLDQEELILGTMDPDVSNALQDAMAKRGVEFFCSAEIKGVALTSDGRKRVEFDREGKRQSVEAEEIIYAIGREPRVRELDLDRAKVRLKKDGHVEADCCQRTSQPHIFAGGDVCGPYEILHFARRQGEIAARNAARLLGRLGGAPDRVDERLKLLAVFTEPEAAILGATEEEVRQAGQDFEVACYPFAEHGRAIVEGETEGLVKLIAKKCGGEILGAAAVGPRAAELIHELVAVMYYRGTARDILAMPHYHPTLSEIWTSAAEKLLPNS